MSQLVQPVVPGISNQFVSTSLYVGDLEPNVSEAQLYELFNQIGAVLSIRVCRDLVTRRSLGYAYVNYNNVQDASRALELLNFTVLNGKPVRIMFSHRDPSIRKSGTANIFIKNLDKSIDNKALHDTFATFGNILSCKVATDGNGQSKGYGFVQFEQEESAQLAIDKVNGMQLVDKQVFVGPFVRRQERELAGGVKFNNVFVKNLSESSTEEDLKKAFGSYGEITSAVVMRDAEGKSKCFGFVNFQNSDEAARAVESLNGVKIDEKEWYVGRAQKKSEREAELKAKFEQERKERIDRYQGANLYLKNLDDDIDDEKLREIFSEYGTIISSKVMRDSNGQSKGSGFVAFSTPEEANRAMELNGKMIGSKPIYVAMAQRKEERRAKLQQTQFAQMRGPVGIGTGVATSMPMYHPGPGLGQQLFYGQPPTLMPPQPAGFGYQQQMLGMRPGGGQLPNFYVPVVQRQAPQAAQRAAGARRGTGTPVPQQQLPPPQQQQMLRAGNRNFRYAQGTRNTPDVPVPPQGLMMPVPLEMAGVPMTPPPTMPISVLASSLASAPPDQQRVMLGEQLYPLVDQLEHDHAGKVTGMLLEMDQTEILHLLESPDALKAKVAEAMDVLKMAQRATSTEQQLSSLSLNDTIPS